MSTSETTPVPAETSSRGDEDEKRRSREAKARADQAIVDQRINAILKQESVPRRPARSKAVSKTRLTKTRGRNNNGNKEVKTSVNLMKKIDPNIFKQESTHTDVGAYAVRNADERESTKSLKESFKLNLKNLAVASSVHLMPEDNMKRDEVEDNIVTATVAEERLSPKGKAIFSIMVLLIVVAGIAVVAVAATLDKESSDGTTINPNQSRTALLIVDVQDCFMGSGTVTASGNPGSLPVAGSENIIPLINQIRDEKSCLFDIVVRTRDFHPKKHISFASTFGLEPFIHLTGDKGELELQCVSIGDGSCCPEAFLDETYDCERKLCPNRTQMELDGTLDHILKSQACSICANSMSSSCFPSNQGMWTDHCEQTGDSGFPRDLVVDAENDVIFEKGTNDYVDGYSPFFDNTGRISSGLGDLFTSKGIEKVYVVGIAFDYGIRYAANQAKLLGYDTSVVADACAVINEGVALETTTELIANKISIINTEDILKLEC